MVGYEFPEESKNYVKMKTFKHYLPNKWSEDYLPFKLLCSSVLYCHREWAPLGLPSRHSRQPSLHQTAEFGWDWPTACSGCGPISIISPIPVTGWDSQSQHWLALLFTGEKVAPHPVINRMLCLPLATVSNYVGSIRTANTNWRWAKFWSNLGAAEAQTTFWICFTNKFPFII